jgi:anti-sigma B factor antagonist
VIGVPPVHMRPVGERRIMSARAPTNYLRVNRRLAGAAVIVRAVGEVDIYTAPVLVEQLAAAVRVASPPAPIVADLREVEFFGAKGIAALVDAQRECRRRCIPLHVVAAPAVARPLDLVDGQKLLIMRPTLTDALAA